MTQQSSILSLFTLLLLTVFLGGLLLSSSSLQTIIVTAAFAQSPSFPSSSLADEIIDEATATSVQDSSSDDNVLEDSNEFGDEAAVIDQDHTAEEQDAVNVGLQDEDATQEQEQEQDAANINVDSDVQEGTQRPQQQPPPPTEEPPIPPEEEGVWCYVSEIPGTSIEFDVCFNTQSECETAQAADVNAISECRRFDEFPPNCVPNIQFLEAACVVTRGIE
jgi:hypothetical protein